MKRGKKYKEALTKVDREAFYGLGDALALLKDMSFAKFDETVELAVKLNIKRSQSVRDTVVLPNQSQKRRRSWSSLEARKLMKPEKPAPPMSGMSIWSRRSEADGWTSMSQSLPLI